MGHQLLLGEAELPVFDWIGREVLLGPLGGGRGPHTHLGREGWGCGAITQTEGIPCLHWEEEEGT